MGEQEEVREPTGDEVLAAKIVELDSRLQMAEMLIKTLGDAVGAELKKRQVSGGWQLYWEKAGRIIVP